LLPGAGDCHAIARKDILEIEQQRWAAMLLFKKKAWGFQRTRPGVGLVWWQGLRWISLLVTLGLCQSNSRCGN